MEADCVTGLQLILLHGAMALDRELKESTSHFDTCEKKIKKKTLICERSGRSGVWCLVGTMSVH